ncbi:MAG: hypothetical protein AAF624_09680 [Bacteroidota bacterium]
MLLRYHAHDVGIVAELMRVQRIAGYEVAPGAPQTLADLFLDTESFSLVDQGFVLRLRQHDGAFYGRLRPLDAPLEKREASHRQAVSGSLALPLSIDGLAAGALRSALRALVADRLLELHARVCIERTPRLLKHGDKVAAMLVLDEVRYEWARDFDFVREVKVRVLGSGKTLHRAAGALDAMLQAYGLRPLAPDRFASVIERLSRASTTPLLLAKHERASLEGIARSSTPIQARRAQTLLAFAARRSVAAVAKEVGLDSERVRLWVQRFRMHRLHMFEEGHANHEAPRVYIKAEVALEEPAMASSYVRREETTLLASAMSPVTSTGRKREGLLQGGVLHTDVGESLSEAAHHEARGNQPTVPFGVVVETDASLSRPNRVGMLGRVARVVTRRRSRVAQPAAPTTSLHAEPATVSALEPKQAQGEGREPLRSSESSGPLMQRQRDETLVETLRADFVAMHEAWEAAFKDWAATAGEQAPTGRLLTVLDQMAGLLSCYQPYLVSEVDALKQAVRHQRAAIARLRACDVMHQLVPETGVLPPPVEESRRLVSRHRFEQSASLLDLNPVDQRVDESYHPVEQRLKDVLDGPILLVSEGNPVGLSAQTKLRHVLASMVWRLYEQVVIRSEHTAMGVERERVTALVGLVVALQRTFQSQTLPESLETRQLYDAVKRARASADVAEALALVETWIVSTEVPPALRTLKQRLEVALLEEHRATMASLSAVLARPFRTYLGVVVAAT